MQREERKCAAFSCAQPQEMASVPVGKVSSHGAMRIVAVGGGEIGRPGYPMETIQIDRVAVELTGKSRPRLVFLPTATGDSQLYLETVQRYFGDRFGCDLVPVCLYRETWNPERLREAVLSADMVYVGGGHTGRMLAKWYEHSLDLVLIEAAHAGIVMSGVSAGAICWFSRGVSDSLGSEVGDRMGLLSGLGLLPITVFPHYSPERFDLSKLPSSVQQAISPVLCLSDCAGLIVSEGSWRVLFSRGEASAQLLWYVDGQLEVEALIPGPLRSLGALVDRGTHNIE